MSSWLQKIRNSSTRRSFTILKNRASQGSNSPRRKSTSLALCPLDEMPTLEEVIRDFEENYLNPKIGPTGSSKSPKRVPKKTASAVELTLERSGQEGKDEKSKSNLNGEYTKRFSVTSLKDVEDGLEGDDEGVTFDNRKTLKHFFMSARWKKSKSKLTKMDATTQTSKFSDLSRDSGCYGSSDSSSDSSTLRKIEMLTSALPTGKIEFAKCEDKKIEIEDPWTILEKLKSSVSLTSIEDSAFYSKMFDLSSVEDASNSRCEPEVEVQEKAEAGRSKLKERSKSKSCSDVSVDAFRVIANDTEVECNFRARSKSCTYEEIQAHVRKLDVALNLSINESCAVADEVVPETSRTEEDAKEQEVLTVMNNDFLLMNDVVYV